MAGHPKSEAGILDLLSPKVLSSLGVLATWRWMSLMPPAGTTLVRLIIVQQGKVKDANILALRAEFLKRFQRYGTLTVLEKEPKGETVLWPTSSRWKVLLDERGEQPTSEQLAKLLRKWTMTHGEVAFLVGDAYGPHAPTKAKADTTLALSSLTLPHQLAHLLLVEQLYRAASILAGSPYHHA